MTPRLMGLEPMQVLESDCPFHKDVLTKVVRIGGIASWLREQGYLDENDDPIGVDDIEFRVWVEGVTEIGMIEYRCRFGCKLNAFALEGGDWAANGTEVRVNDLMDFFPAPNAPRMQPCSCDEDTSLDWYFLPDGACSCGIVKHHYHCPKCRGYTQIG